MKKKKSDNIIRASESPRRKRSKQSRHGPEPERLKIDGNWTDAVDHAIKVKRPSKGWPK